MELDFLSELILNFPIIELGAIVCAIVFPIARLVSCRVRGKDWPHHLLLFLNLLRGAAFFPFVALIIAVFYGPLFEHLLRESRTTLFLAGVIGGFAVYNSDTWIINFIRDNIQNLKR